MFELQKKKKKYSVRDFVTIVLFECGSGGLDHETGAEYCSFGIQDRFSMRKSATAASYCLFGPVAR
jgi:hypothetical protein